MSDDFPTQEEQDLALNAIALVRLALSEETLERTNEMANVIVDGLDDDEKLTLMFRIADLCAVVLQSWHQAALMTIPPEFHDDIASPDEVLNGLVTLVVTGDEPPEDV